MVNRKVRKPNVIRGGTAVPLGRNYYYMSGRKHETGGIDIGKNPRTGIEVEDGEVMHVGKDEIKVFSAQPFLNGKSPAQRVMQGDNPNVIFNAQERYKKRNKLNDDGTKKKRMGGLSRDKDYRSKSKPYPNVKSKDFAGGHRSYPIPTKADARDALRLAGLHGRSDVKAKVYRKYPELRRKARNGGLYSVTVNGVTKLYQFPSTGGVQKATTSKPAKTINNKRKRFVTGGKDKENTEGISIPQVEEIPANFSIEQTPSVVPLEAIHFNNIQKSNRNKNNTSQSIIDRIKENPESLTDAIGLASNIGFSIAGNRMNNRFLDRMKYRNQPVPYQATKLKTKININPQLDKMRESLAEYERNIDNNTASSRVALARKQRARLANVLQTNELFGTKENMETELINTDRLNQQTISNKNIENYNNWAEGESAFRNAILEKKAENNIAMANNINAGVQDAVNKFSRRKNEFRTISAMSLASPNLPAEMLYASGIWNKKIFDTYRKAYPLKGNKRRTNSND